MGPKPKSVWSLGLRGPTQWICREWVEELGPNELYSSKSWIKWQLSTNKRYWCQWTLSPRRLLLCMLITIGYWDNLGCYSVLSLFLSDPHIALFELSWSYTCWSSEFPLECPSHQTPPFSLLWVVVTKATLFRGPLHINAARKVAAMHLMRW